MHTRIVRCIFIRIRVNTQLFSTLMPTHCSLLCFTLTVFQSLSCFFPSITLNIGIFQLSIGILHYKKTFPRFVLFFFYRKITIYGFFVFLIRVLAHYAFTDLMEKMQFSIKFTENVVTTNKFVSHLRSTDTAIRRKVVRIILADADATDSSDDESDDSLHRVRRHVEEIKFNHLPPRMETLRKRKRRRISSGNEASRRQKFGGVGRWPCERCAAEIRDLTTKGERAQLGIYNTSEEAATVGLKSPAAAPAESRTESDALPSGKDGALSPTSVLRYEEFTPLDDLDVDYGIDLDWQLSLPLTGMSANFYAEEFSDFDFDNFINELR